jgi:phi13 family phage major tail protein
MPRVSGLSNISFATLLTDVAGGTATYGAVAKCERSIKAKITPKSNSEKTYSDDAVEDVLNAFDSVEVEIELNQLSLATRALLLGSKVVKGNLIENKNDISPFVAMIFKGKMTDGKYRYVCLYKGKFELASDEFETEADKIKTQTATVKATFVARECDGNYKLMADESVTVGATKVDLEKWFTTVPLIPSV